MDTAIRVAVSTIRLADSTNNVAFSIQLGGGGRDAETDGIYCLGFSCA